MRPPRIQPRRRMAPVALALPLLLAGCVYRMNIQQGNYLEGKTIDQLQVGMTRSQVRYLLGTPMVPNAFNDERWDYVYYLKKGRLRKAQNRHVIVVFRDDKVVSIDRASMPASAKVTMPDPQQPVPRSGVAPSEPAAALPEGTDATQPGVPQPPSTQPPEPPPEPRE